MITEKLLLDGLLGFRGDEAYSEIRGVGYVWTYTLARGGWTDGRATLERDRDSKIYCIKDCYVVEDKHRRFQVPVLDVNADHPAVKILEQVENIPVSLLSLTTSGDPAGLLKPIHEQIRQMQAARKKNKAQNRKKAEA